MRIANTMLLLAIGWALTAWSEPVAAAPDPPAAAEPAAPAAQPPAAEPAPEVKPPEAKPAETKPPEGAPAEAKSPEAKPPEAKPPEAQPAQSEAEQLFEQGRDALLQAQYDRAIELLTKAVALDGTKTSYRLHLARAYRYAGKDDKAEPIFEAILKATPDHVEAAQGLAEIFTKAARWKDVVRVLEPLLEYRHDYPTYHMLAEAHYTLGELEKASKDYEEAVKLNPQSALDHYQLGNIYLAGNFFALAAESYRSALQLGMDSPVLRYKLGSAYFNLRNYFGAIAVRTVKSGQPGTISGDWYLVEPVPGHKDVFRCAPENSAIYQVAKALADGIEPRPDIFVLRASIYLSAHRYQRAYDLFTEIGPKVPDADKALYYYYYAQAALGTGRYDEYLALLGKAIELDPAAYKSALVDAYLQVADQYNQAGQLDKYIQFLADAVAQSPTTASLHLKLGNAYEEDQKYDLAIAQWRMVLDLEPDHPDRLRLLNLIEKYTSGAPLSVGPTQPSPPAAAPAPAPPPAAPPATSPAAPPAPAAQPEAKQ